MIAIQERCRISGTAPVFSQDLAGDDVQEGGFAFTVGADQPDVFSLEQTKGRVLQNLACPESMGDFFDS